MVVENKLSFRSALDDFRLARRQAAMQQMLARFTGANIELLSYEDVKHKLKVTNVRQRGLEDIPLDKIVGSVGRYKDFTRNFLPKQEISEQRWARVKSVVTDQVGAPPIEAYKVGDAYFVIDGNHRVSIARQMGAPTISGFVTEVTTRVPLTADDNPEELICKARYAEFLEETNLDKLRPEADLLMTFCAQYRVLLEHIHMHRYFMGLDQNRHDIPYEEAVAHWYDEVYMPVIHLVRELGILRNFPERTEADMYLLLAEHRAELQEALGWEVDTETAVSDLASQKSTKTSQVLSRMLDAVVPDELEFGPKAGEWRRQRVEWRDSDRLFNDIVVAIRGEAEDWRVLDQAIVIAGRENSRLLGVHVEEAGQERQPDEPDLNQILREQFDRRCAEAGVQGEFAVEWGAVARRLAARAAYADLLMVALNYPPGLSLVERLTSGLQTILKRCPRPILPVPPGEVSPLNHALLAYDGSPKAEEALFVATYLATRWQVQLSVLTVGDLKSAVSIQAQAKAYLEEHGVTAAYATQPGNVSDNVLKTAAHHGVDFLIMGGFSFSSMLSLVLGSSVNRLLRQYHRPILICR